MFFIHADDSDASYSIEPKAKDVGGNGANSAEPKSNVTVKLEMNGGRLSNKRQRVLPHRSCRKG